jgi:hypothetical protein
VEFKTLDEVVLRPGYLLAVTEGAQQGLEWGSVARTHSDEWIVCLFVVGDAIWWKDGHMHPTLQVGKDYYRLIHASSIVATAAKEPVPA